MRNLLPALLMSSFVFLSHFENLQADAAGNSMGYNSAPTALGGMNSNSAPGSMNYAKPQAANKMGQNSADCDTNNTNPHNPKSPKDKLGTCGVFNPTSPNSPRCANGGFGPQCLNNPFTNGKLSQPSTSP